MKMFLDFKTNYWVLCLSGALVFKRHFLTFFIVYYAAFTGLYLYSLIVILLLEPKNIQRSPEMRVWCGRVTEKLKCRVKVAFSMGRRKSSYY